MDITELSRKHLEDAVELGYITVDGKELHLTAPQILTVARYILKEGLFNEAESDEANAPSEMFSAMTDEQRMGAIQGASPTPVELTTEFIDVAVTSDRHFFEDTSSILESDY